MRKISFAKIGLCAFCAATVFAVYLSANAANPAKTVTIDRFEPEELLLNTIFPYSLKLKHTVNVVPTEYRASRFMDFHDAKWLPYTSLPIIKLQAAWFGPLTPPQGSFDKKLVIYFQVRLKNPHASRT